MVAMELAGVLTIGHPALVASTPMAPRSISVEAGGIAHGAPKGPAGTEKSGTWARGALKSSAEARLFAVASRTVSGSSPQRHSIIRSTDVWSNCTWDTAPA